MRTITGTLERVERANNSVYGNPNYLLTVDGETYRTQSDAASSYEIGNIGYRVGDRVELQLSRANRVRIVRSVNA